MFLNGTGYICHELSEEKASVTSFALVRALLAVSVLVAVALKLVNFNSHQFIARVPGTLVANILNVCLPWERTTVALTVCQL